MDIDIRPVFLNEAGCLFKTHYDIKRTCHKGEDLYTVCGLSHKWAEFMINNQGTVMFRPVIVHTKFPDSKVCNDAVRTCSMSDVAGGAITGVKNNNEITVSNLASDIGHIKTVVDRTKGIIDTCKYIEAYEKGFVDSKRRSMVLSAKSKNDLFDKGYKKALEDVKEKSNKDRTAYNRKLSKIRLKNGSDLDSVVKSESKSFGPKAESSSADDEADAQVSSMPLDSSGPVSSSSSDGNTESDEANGLIDTDEDVFHTYNKSVERSNNSKASLNLVARRLGSLEPRGIATFSLPFCIDILP